MFEDDVNLPSQPFTIAQPADWKKTCIIGDILEDLYTGLSLGHVMNFISIILLFIF